MDMEPNPTIHGGTNTIHTYFYHTLSIITGLLGVTFTLTGTVLAALLFDVTSLIAAVIAISIHIKLHQRLGGVKQQMKNKAYLTVALFCALLIGIVTGAVVQQYYYPQTATINEAPLVECYLEDTPWLNGTTINWGNLTAGQTHSRMFNARNIGNVNCTVYIKITGLPINWTQTWTCNNTFLEPTDIAIGNLTLTIPTTTMAGNYTWTSHIMAQATTGFAPHSVEVP